MAQNKPQRSAPSLENVQVDRFVNGVLLECLYRERGEMDRMMDRVLEDGRMEGRKNG